MELNNLLTKITHQQEEEPKKFLALVITEETLQAAVWSVRDTRTEVLNIGSLEPWNSVDDIEDYLEKLDKSITNATSGEDINETIFGIPEDWVKENIVPDKLALIKRFTTEFELKALGYVTISDSMIKYIKLKEGSPASAIFIQVDDSFVNVTVVRLGKVLGKHSVGRSDDVGQDTEEALSRIKITDNLPSRMIVYSETQDIDDLIQNLNSYDWKSKFNFLHLPKIESLPKGSIITAVAVAGGSEVAKSIGIDVEFDAPLDDSDTESQSTFQSAVNEPSTPNDTAEEQGVQDDKHSSSAKDFGFVLNQDITNIKPEEPSTSPPHVPASPKTPSFIKKLKSPTLPKLSLRSMKLPKSKWIAPLIGLLLFISLVYAAIYQIPKTTITIYLEPRSLEEKVELTISPNVSSVNTESATIPAKVITTTVSGNETIPTTGVKTVGDSATGTVTVYNRTSLDKTFGAGTVISTGDYEYEFQDEVTVEASSEGPDYSVIPGTADVSISALDIGEDYNKDAGVEFTVESFSPTSFVAKNSEPITGGTSTEIKVASEEDAAALLTSLTSKLESDATSNLQKEGNDQTGLYIQKNLTDIVKEEYSSEIGEETNNLTLNLELELSGLTYNKQDIELLISDRSNASIPTGYTKTSIPIEVTTSEEEELDNGEISLLANIKIKLLPQINESELKTALAGDTTSELTSTLKELTGFSRAEAKITPSWLPPRLSTVSKNPNNITLILTHAE